MVARTYANLEAETNKQLAANIPFNGKSDRGSTGDEVLNALDFNPAPNALWAFGQSTYHWRFYLQNDYNPESGNSVTIAETGVTGLNIQDVKLDTFVGPNLKTKNTIATSVSIKVFEPYGSNLPDMMVAAAQALGIKNYYKCPWKLDLTFLGYDDNRVARRIDELGVWSWDLMITNVSTQITEAGSTHIIEAIPFSEIALTNQYAMLPTSAAPKGSTVGEVLQSLIGILNKDQQNKYGTLFTEYAIEDRPYQGENISGITSPFQHKISAVAPQNNDERNAEGGQYSPGTDIPSIIDGLFASSDTAVAQMVQSRNIDPAAKQDEIKSVVSLFHRVDTKVELKGFDYVIGDYAKKITFIVRPYDTMRLLTNVTTAEEYNGKPAVQNRKLEYAKKRLLLQKEYNYIFTGKNTDVEKFDINLNFRWQVSIPQLYGTVHYGTATNPREFKQAEELKRLQGQQGQLNALNQKITELEFQKSNTPQSDPDTIKNIDQQIAAQTNARDRLAQRQAADKAQYEQKIIRTPEPKVANKFAEDLIKNKTASAPPITLAQDGDNPMSQTAWGTSSHANAGKSIYGTLLNQLYGTYDANLLQIELNIRGDPYWLGPDKETLAAESNPESSSSFASFINGEHMFVFRYKLPQGVDEKTGVVSLKQDESYTGFYAATQITHSFSGGVFKQTINANRIAGMVVTETARQIKGESI